MAKQARQCLIVGNWKMYKTIDEAVAFIEQIAPLAEKSSCKVMLAVPFTAIKTLSDKAAGTNIIIGAQNMNDAKEGAFTGEVAASMLKNAGAQFVLIGHSERRQLFHEDNAFINRKVLRAIETGLNPLLCVGESFDERQENKTEEVVKEQLTQCLQGVAVEALNTLTIAYEPVWAIGTGLAASCEQASHAMKQCRDVLGQLYDAKSVQSLPLLYGGSVNAQNAENYLNSDEIDGLLIGSASLATDSFAKIISLRQNVETTAKV
jgi:triosephosphate isomerase (TIM)